MTSVSSSEKGLQFSTVSISFEITMKLPKHCVYYSYLKVCIYSLTFAAFRILQSGFCNVEKIFIFG
jgi:hypothetical protein